MWVLFQVPCPTQDGQTAKQLYEKRIPWITEGMQLSAMWRSCSKVTSASYRGPDVR